MKKVYIDCGHGGADSGAICKAKNVFEKNIVLEVGKLVDAKLRKCGVDVKLSRTNDLTKSLAQRTTEANNWGADCLVSIHVNDASNTSAKGLETYCYKFKYRKLADCVHEELVRASLYTKNRGVKEGNLHMVRESNMSACLVEIGFISNIDDLNLIESKKDEFALAIADGICNYLGVRYVNNTPKSDATIYNIVTGGFGAKEVAQEKLDHLYGLTGWYLELEEFTPGDWRIRTGGFTGEDRVKRELEALKELTGWWCTYILE